jgi:membrane fusion protein, multidrug efflux system
VTGTLEPYRQVEVRAQVPGVVAELRVDRGDAVGSGQLLARIEAEGIRGQAASARAGVASAEANLALARRQLESARTLHAAGAMSDIEFEQAQAAFEAAQAQLAAAEAQAVGAGESARRASVSAPIAGEISDRTVSEGEAVNVGQALLTIVNSSFLELEGNVPVNDAVGIRAGMPVEFTIDAYPGRTFSGTVARVEPTADPGTRQVGVYVRLPNQDRGLLGGLFATGRILTGERQTVTVVPEAAVRGSGDGAHVFAIRDGRAVRVPVEVGARSESEGVIEITAGLEAGETVIVAPGAIEDGTEIRLAAPAATVPAEER